MAETDFKYDVFISYSHKDEEWVHNILLPTLESHGVNACIDYRDFVGGSPSVKEMERAVKESRKTLTVLTPNYLASGWADFELSIAQTLDPGNQDLRVIPLLKTQCELPLRIAYLSYINFTNPDNELIAWRQLLTGLGKQEVIEQPIQIPSPANWYLPHPYAMSKNFTGRVAELQMLDKWLIESDKLLVLRALGGFGKSALAWQWINTHVNPAKWTKLVWWSFYESNASFEHFIEETLKYLKLKIPKGQRTQVDELLKAMKAQKILFVLDGFERAMRAYSSMNAAYQGDEEPKRENNERDCVNINAEIFLKNVCVLPGIKSKVFMTTRLTPRAIEPHGQILQGCLEKELNEMDKGDAVTFFHTQGIRGIRAEIETTCATYGYHPLSLRILAGLIASDREIPGDIVSAKKLDITNDVVANKRHVLEVGYNTLSSDQQKLLSTIACFRAPTTYDILKSITMKNIDTDLRALEIRCLLHWDKKANKYDLHPIVRSYAYECLTVADRTTIHTHLRDYFEVVPILEKIEKWEELTPVIELYYHTVQAGEIDKAATLYYEHIMNPLYYQFGKYHIGIELLSILFLAGEDNLPPIKDETGQEWALNALAIFYSLSGQPHRAVPLIERHNHLCEKIGHKTSLAVGLGNIAFMAQIFIGVLREAEANLKHSLTLGEQIGDLLRVGRGYQELGRLRAYFGRWNESERDLIRAQEDIDKHHDNSFPSSIRAYRALRALLMARDPDQSTIDNQSSAIQFAHQALELAEETARTSYPRPRDFVQSNWLLGAAFRLNGQLNLAEQHLGEALTRDRAINMVDFEADILLDLARLRYDQRNYEEAKSLAKEALIITERCGYVLQGADVNLFLAQYALEQEKDKVKAKGYAETALKLATCDGPPYYYKAAYEEAERMLEGL